MNYPLRLVVYKGNTIFEDVIVTIHYVYTYENYNKTNTTASQLRINNNSHNVYETRNFIPLNKCGYNAHLISAYILTLKRSDIYRKSAVKMLQKFLNLSFDDGYRRSILIRLRTPKQQFLDYKWNKIVTHMVLEKKETEHAMSWLSTLGGAFSALGEQFQHCAEIAGKISVKQFELALRLGNPLLLARCELYAALSLIQRGQLKTPKYIIRNIYQLAIDEKDIRLQNMCQGVWAKLKYCYKMKKQEKGKVIKI